MSDDCQPCRLLEEDQIRAASSILVRFTQRESQLTTASLNFGSVLKVLVQHSR